MQRHHIWDLVLSLNRRKQFDSTIQHSEADTNDAVVLDDRAVLAQLESELPSHSNASPLSGIRNGVIIGAVIWLGLLMAAFSIFG